MIEILGKYINSRTKIKCKCKICDHIWYPKAGEIKGCPKCDKLNRGNKLRKTHKQFVEVIAEKVTFLSSNRKKESE